MSIRPGDALRWVLDGNSKLSPPERLVLLCLVSYSNERNEAWPSKNSIRKRTGLSLSGVKRALASLEASTVSPFVLERIRRQQTGTRVHESTLYRLTPRRSTVNPPHGSTVNPPVGSQRPEGGSTEPGGVGPEWTEGRSTVNPDLIRDRASELATEPDRGSEPKTGTRNGSAVGPRLCSPRGVRGIHQTEDGPDKDWPDSSIPSEAV